MTGFSATAAGEAARMAAEQVRRAEPSVREAENPDPSALGEPLRDCPVDEAEEVGLIELAPAPAQRRAERLAVADRSAWVRGQHVEPRVRQRHHLDPRHRAVGEVGPAVDVQHEAARPAPRAPEEALDDRPAAHLRLHALGLVHVRPEPARAVARQRAQPAVLDREDLARLAVDAGGDRDPPAACAERVRDHLAVDERLGGTIAARSGAAAHRPWSETSVTSDSSSSQTSGGGNRAIRSTMSPVVALKCVRSRSGGELPEAAPPGDVERQVLAAEVAVRVAAEHGERPARRPAPPCAIPWASRAASRGRPPRRRRSRPAAPPRGRRRSVRSARTATRSPSGCHAAPATS